MFSWCEKCVMAWVVLALAWTTACGGDSSTGSTTDTEVSVGDLASMELPPLDAVFPETWKDPGNPDLCLTCQLDQQPDVEDAGPHDLTDQGPIPEECQDGSECLSGLCVETEDGSKVCAPPCLDEDCPKGWECRPVTGIGGDVTFVCLPAVGKLCRPCLYHTDCRPAGVDTDDLCVDWGSDGSFCGRDCSQDGLCPDGYSCFDVSDPNDREKVLQQCLPTEGECECTPAYMENGYKTGCYFENDEGICWGERRCGPEGLTACDATVPEKEVCDGQDQNCDGTTDEGITAGECEKSFDDIVCVGPEVCEGGVLTCKAQEPGPEACDGLDNDCDGITDPEDSEGCWQLFHDGDGDTYGTSDVRCLCGPDGAWSAQAPGDCDDGDVWINPSVAEACNGKDDDCDGLTDEKDAIGCQLYHFDGDFDGWGLVDNTQCLCEELPGWVPSAGDCEDGNPDIHPEAPEVCDGADNDCNGVTDGEGSVGCVAYHYDGDDDGWGVEGDQKCLCALLDEYTSKQPGDCEDADPDVNPGTAETCDGIDNDCNDGVDEAGALGCTVYYADQDSDGWGNTLESQCLCSPVFPYLVTQPGDCADTEPFAFPGGEEKCNGKDDDCDGTTDEVDATGCQTFYFDSDSDGWGLANNTQCLCGPSGLYTGTQAGDCNDYDGAVHPGAPEACDGKDNDCNQHVDEGEGGSGCTNYYQDGDSDGWGLTASAKCLCKITGTYSTGQDGDCNDGNINIHPAALEVCNSQDDDCDMETDEGEGIAGCSIYYFDGDSDGWGVGSNTGCYCKPTGSYKAFNPGDCDDAHNTAHPGGNEVCDLLDNDCNGVMDDPFIPETYKSYHQDGTYAGSMSEDLPNAWFGPYLGTCIYPYCTGITQSVTGRLLPAGDSDWAMAYAEDSSWGAVFSGKVTLTGPAGKSYKVCACWSTSDTLCGYSGLNCATSMGGKVEVQTTSPFVYQAWLDFYVSPAGAGDYGCGQYSMTWSISQ